MFYLVNVLFYQTALETMKDVSFMFLVVLLTPPNKLEMLSFASNNATYVSLYY